MSESRTELLVPISVVADETLPAGTAGLSTAHECMIFSDGTRVDWKTASVPGSTGTPSTYTEAYLAYEADGTPIVDPARALRRARVAWTAALMDEAFDQQRPELFPPISLLGE